MSDLSVPSNYILFPGNMIVLLITASVAIGNIAIMIYYGSIAYRRKLYWSVPHLIVVINAVSLLHQVVTPLTIYIELTPIMESVVSIRVITGLLSLFGLALLQVEVRVAFGALFQDQRLPDWFSTGAKIVVLFLHVILCFPAYGFPVYRPFRWIIPWGSSGFAIQAILMTFVNVYLTVTIARRLAENKKKMSKNADNSSRNQIVIWLSVTTIMDVAAVVLYVVHFSLAQYTSDMEKINLSRLMDQLSRSFLGIEAIAESLVLLAFTTMISPKTTKVQPASGGRIKQKPILLDTTTTDSSICNAKTLIDSQTYVA
ncbi:hypothetical protein O5D80_001240 [Batrachochytrium dendrobatidis]|nr:hypothetical protein O5D80_001240 [Batrachochytrium dendrobatidis]